MHLCPRWCMFARRWAQPPLGWGEGEEGSDSNQSVPCRFVSTCPRPRGYFPGACMVDVWKPVPGSFRP
eukprot:1419722-Prymnesium_polylepis.1